LQYPAAAAPISTAGEHRSKDRSIGAHGDSQNAGPDGYDKARRAIEFVFADTYVYSLDLKATGEEPLSDFLFRVARAGHCE